LTLTFKSRTALYFLFYRLGLLLWNRDRLKYLARASLLTWKRSRADRPLWFYFKFWLFNWSNSLVKYSRVRRSDFDIESVQPDFSSHDPRGEASAG